MWRHPKYYKELAKKRKQLEREQANERASEQARRVGGPTSREQGSEQASNDQASEEDSSNKRWMWSQSFIAREGVSRWSTSRPWIALLSNNFTSLREGWCTSIKLRFVRVMWKSFWCGLKEILGPLATFISTMKKPQESLYPNKSGTPKDAQDSSLVHWIWGVFFLSSFHNLLSLTIVHWLLSYARL